MNASLTQELLDFNESPLYLQQEFVATRLSQRDEVLEAAKALSGDIYYALCEAFRAEELKQSHDVKFN